MKVILYARFSPRPNAEECDSVESQLRDLRAFFHARGDDVVGEFSDEALSGADHERPGFWDAIAALKKGYALGVRNLNRLARDTLFALTMEQELKKIGCTLVSMEDGGEQKDTPTDKLLRTILHAIAEYQRLTNNARTRAAMLRHQERGRRMSDRTPYGKRPDWNGPLNDKGLPANLIDDPQEQAVIAQIVAFHAAGVKLREICRRLEAEGVSCRGGRWHHVTVARILRRAGAL